MGLEVASFINDLVSANPAGGDGKSQGDDHIRLIKTVLLATFPLAVGARKFRDDDAGATDTLSWTLYRKSASPAANDLLASYVISGDSSTAVERVYARLRARADVVTNAAEDGSWLFYNMASGVETLHATLNKTGFTIVPPLLGAGKPPTFQEFLANGTWTKPAGCRFAMAEGVGGGGGSGGSDGQGAGTVAVSGGGSSGLYGDTGIINVSATVNSAVTIGTGGAGGAAGNNPGSDGNLSRIILGGTTFTWNGGQGSNGYTGNVSVAGVPDGGIGASTTGSNLMKQSSSPGMFGIGHADPSTSAVQSGFGGASPYGLGGGARHSIVPGALAGIAASANSGGGGGGSASVDTTANAAGGAGGSGYIRVWEFY